MNQIMQHDFEGSSPVAGHYYAKSLGAPFKVYLANGVETKLDPVTGRLVTNITDLPGLIAAVVRCRVMHPRKLSGTDLRFIRSALCLKSKVLASAIELTPEHYSRCEAGLKTMSTSTERIFRCYVYLASVGKDKGVQDTIKKQNEVKKQILSEDAQKMIAAFQNIFFEMKIHLFHKPGEDLEFTFGRRCPEDDTPCEDGEAKWKNEREQIAA